MGSFSKIYQGYLHASKQILPDDQIGYLPWQADNKLWQTHWHEHGENYMRLGDRIRSTPGHLRILDVGCGNGWMSGRLAMMENTEVYGVDIADFQLDQARRVYEGKSNLHFLKADIFNDSLPISQFDFILVADSAQFFPEIGLLISQLKEMLAPTGQIHLTGKDFWLIDQIEDEKERMWAKFDELRVPKMREFYHFHSVEHLTVLGANCLYDPQPQTGGIRSLLRRGHEFGHYWWTIGGG